MFQLDDRPAHRFHDEPSEFAGDHGAHGSWTLQFVR